MDVPATLSAPDGAPRGLGGDVCVDEELFGGVAHAGALGLGVHEYPFGHDEGHELAAAHRLADVESRGWLTAASMTVMRCPCDEVSTRSIWRA